MAVDDSEPGGLPSKNKRRYSLEILKKILKRYQGPVLWARPEIFFTPKRHQFQSITLFLVIFFGLKSSGKVLQ